MKVQEVKKVENLDQEIERIINSENSKSNKMKELFVLGLEIKEIASLLEVRYNFVYNVISNFTIINSIETQKEEKESKKDQVIELHNQGKTNIEISRILKTNYNYIYKIIKEYKELEVAK